MNIFTWWNGATIGTVFGRMRNFAKVGEDALGNVYFEAKKARGSELRRRWVMYRGSNDVSRVSPEWHGWLRGQLDVTPDQLPAPRAWVKPPTPNQTGTRDAYRPAGALEAGGKRVAATGDYEAWSPEA